MEPSEKLDLLLNDIEMNCDPAIGGQECNRFSMDCLSLIRAKLPPVAADAFLVATEYFEGRVPLQSVNDMKVKCWQYLDDNHRRAPLGDPTVSAIRAVIFPLDAQLHPEQRDIVDHLSSFLMLVNQVEPHFDEEEALLRKYFASCLESPTINR